MSDLLKGKLTAHQLLGLPPEKEMRRWAMDAVKAAEPDQGISARGMAKRYPTADWLSWTDVLASLNREGQLRTCWRPCPGGGAAVLQELRYVLPGERG